MKIIVDVMGGDNAPDVPVLASLAVAAEHPEINIIMVGDEEIMKMVASEHNVSLNLPNIETVHTSDFITMEDSALSVVRSKSASSMGVALRMLSEGKGDAFVSAGNTGALHAGSSLIVRRIKGIQRSAIASVLPFACPILLVDSGANIEVEPSYLQQFAVMGSIYMKMLFDVENPRVGLLNNGAEKTKGTKTLVETYQLLESDPAINFVGNIEGRDVPFGKCDVLVTDGFSGNVLLKLSEGLGSFMMGRLKDCLTQNLVTKASAMIIGGNLKKMKKQFDSSEYGGAPLLGLTKPVLKAHGSSDEKAFGNAIRKAVDFASTQVTVEIAKWVSADLEKKKAEEEARKAAETAEKAASENANDENKAVNDILSSDSNGENAGK